LPAHAELWQRPLQERDAVGVPHGIQS
jgi:hypothetical protein